MKKLNIMKKLLLLLMILPLIGFGQNIEAQDAETDEVEMIEEEEFEEPFAFIYVEQMPLFTGCKDDECTTHKIMKFISKNFKYPEIAKKNGVEGRVIVQFVVEKDGTVGRVKILAGLNPNLYRNLSKEEEENLRNTLDLNKEELQTWINNANDGINNECIRVIKLLPKFTPGKQIGKAVPVRYTVPIKLSLS
jgi:periplasmic protein TonB